MFLIMGSHRKGVGQVQVRSGLAGSPACILHRPILPQRLRRRVRLWRPGAPGAASSGGRVGCLGAVFCGGARCELLVPYVQSNLLQVRMAGTLRISGPSARLVQPMLHRQLPRCSSRGRPQHRPHALLHNRRRRIRHPPEARRPAGAGERTRCAPACAAAAALQHWQHAARQEARAPSN